MNKAQKEEIAALQKKQAAERIALRARHLAQKRAEVEEAKAEAEYASR